MRPRIDKRDGTMTHVIIATAGTTHCFAQMPQDDQSCAIQAKADEVVLNSSLSSLPSLNVSFRSSLSFCSHHKPLVVSQFGTQNQTHLPTALIFPSFFLSLNQSSNTIIPIPSQSPFKHSFRYITTDTYHCHCSE